MNYALQLGDKKMKPFNLGRALAGDPVVMRFHSTGIEIEVSEIHHFKTESSNKPVCIIANGNVHWSSIDGKVGANNLFMATKKRTVYVNFYASGNGSWSDTKEDALNNVGMSAIHVAIPVEI